jgi:hypothetical protein
MAKAKKAKQIRLETPNEVGMLEKVSAAIAKAKVNINALCAYGMGEKGQFLLLVDRPAKAKSALSKAGFSPTEEEAILVEMVNRPGEMQRVSEKISDAGIDINYVYGSAGSGASNFCVFRTNDDSKAIKALKK